MPASPAPGPWSDDEFPCDHELSRPVVPRRPLRRDLHEAHSRASSRLSGIDAELEALVRRRRACLAELEQLRARLNRRWTHNHVRRHARVDEAPMPPAPPGAEALHGTDLRAVCTTLLRRHGPLELRALHGLLHQYGYTVGGRRPVQRLGDAMAYELQCGRAERLSRGVYAACDAGPRQITPCELDPVRPVPLVPWVPLITDPAPPHVDPPVVADPEHWSGGWHRDATEEQKTAPDDTARRPQAGPTSSDPRAGDPTAADPTAGDPTAGDPIPADTTGHPDATRPGRTLPPPALGDDSPTNRPRGSGNDGSGRGSRRRWRRRLGRWGGRRDAGRRRRRGG